MVRLVTRSAKAKFGQVGDQVRKVKDQVGQGKGQELDNTTSKYIFGLTFCPISGYILRKTCKFL